VAGFIRHRFSPEIVPEKRGQRILAPDVRICQDRSDVVVDEVGAQIIDVTRKRRHRYDDVAEYPSGEWRTVLQCLLPLPVDIVVVVLVRCSMDASGTESLSPSNKLRLFHDGYCCSIIGALALSLSLSHSVSSGCLAGLPLYVAGDQPAGDTHTHTPVGRIIRQ